MRLAWIMAPLVAVALAVSGGAAKADGSKYVGPIIVGAAVGAVIGAVILSDRKKERSHKHVYHHHPKPKARDHYRHRDPGHRHYHHGQSRRDVIVIEKPARPVKAKRGKHYVGNKHAARHHYKNKRYDYRKYQVRSYGRGGWR